MARPFEFNRNEALDKAMLLFWTKGYFNTSSQDIVDHMELSRSSIYNSFTDKRTLFIEALKHYIDIESKALTDALSQMNPDKKNLKRLLETVVENNFLKIKPQGCLVLNTTIEIANHDDEIKKIVESNVRQTIAAFEKFIRAGQQQGNFGKSIPAEDLSITLFHQLAALRVMGKLITNKTFFKKTIQTFMLLFN